MRSRGVGTELGHSLLSPELWIRSEVRILYYDTEEYVRCNVVQRLH
jgi:hypothetical protein